MSEKIFEYFKEICSIPHGSGDMEKIAEYCIEFALSNQLKYERDSANNVIIYKNGSKGYENSAPIILQGHLDMVCQKTSDSNIDFSKDGIESYTDGEFIKANNTSLGADNGIAVSMILAILSDNSLAHPPIEAVFTTDEEIGMIGASKLDFSLLSAKKMINIDSEEADTITVSCAGGSDFSARIPVKRENKNGVKAELTLKGLKGGHSGIEIDKGRINADILMGRVLNSIDNISLISLNGGDKGNAIPNRCTAEILCDNYDEFRPCAEGVLNTIKREISARESDFDYEIKLIGQGEYDTFADSKSIITALYCAPCGICEMSAEIDGLVETSLNLGILKTEKDAVLMHFALRSNKQSALIALQDKLSAYFSLFGATVTTSGHYPPWEFNENSVLREQYREIYKNATGKEVKVEAIHAGLECGVFASGIKGLDCIAIGPDLFDVHTVNERLDIASTRMIFDNLLKILEKNK